MKVQILTALQDNYIYLIDNEEGQCIVVDPGESQPVLSALANRTLAAILLTHRHADHCDGVAQLCERYPNAIIYAPAECHINNAIVCRSGDVIDMPPPFDLSFSVLATPGHTSGHIVYWGNGAVFSGDTLFIAGCGRVFEGTMHQMYDSLMTLKSLPQTTKIYCGHDYTMNNLLFAQAVEPQNTLVQQKLQWLREQKTDGLPSVPGTIAEECEINPFFRTAQDSVINAASQHCQRQLTDGDGATVFSILRQWKDEF